MFWYFLFGLTASADGLCTEGGPYEREACLRYEIEKLKGSKGIKGTQELEVFGKPMLNFNTVDINWLQGQESPQLGQDGLTILVFWEVWCPHCKREIPNMQKMLDTYNKDGLQVVGFTKMSRGKTEEDIKQFLKETGVSYSIGVEDGTLSKYFNVSGIPAAAVVQNGTVVYRGHPARITDKMITEWIDR